jgi:small subunit ribosomal protein S11
MGKKRIASQTEEELLKENEKVEKKVGREVKIEAAKIREARVYISSTYNNTAISLADLKGNVLGWTSAGSIGFKGSKKSTPFAASKVAETIAQTAQKIGVGKIHVYIKGVGSGRDSALRSLAAKGLELAAIKDITPIPHNGCRPRKPRRV